VQQYFERLVPVQAAERPDLARDRLDGLLARVGVDVSLVRPWLAVALDAPAEEVQALVYVGDQRLGLRQAKAHRCQRRRCLLAHCLDVRPLAFHQKHPVVGIPREPEHRQGSLLTSGQASSVPGLAVEMLIELAQRDVRQQRRQNAALGRARVRFPQPGLLAEDPGLQECLDQRQDPPVGDTSPHQPHQSGMVDLVEAGRDIALQHPLIAMWGAGERADLGDRVVCPALRAEPVGARQEVGFEYRLQDQLQRCLHNPISHGSDAQPAQLAARFRNHPLADRQGTELPRLQVLADLGEKRFHASARLDEERGGPIHPGRPGTPVAPHSLPGDQQERGITNEVEHIVELATRVVACPPVQLGLDLLYPQLRPIRQGPLRLRPAGIHRRPPGIPASLLPACWLPSPCGRLSRPPTTTKPPSHPATISRRRACPSQPWRDRKEGSRGRFPRSPGADRRGRCPAMPRPPRHRYAAGFPHGLPAGPSIPATESPGPCPRRACTAYRPRSARFESARRLRSFTHWFLSCTFSSCLPDPPRLAVPGRPVVVRTAPALPGDSRIRLSSASPGCCDSPAARAFHPSSAHVRSVRGALPVLPPVGLPEPPPEPGVHR
jgi:hypothetical protein